MAIKKITKEDAKSRVADLDKSFLQKMKGPIFELQKSLESKQQEDSMLEIEVLLRRGKRVGLFNEK